MKKKLFLIPLFLLIMFAIFLISEYAILAHNTKKEITSFDNKINLDSSLFTKKDSEEVITQDPIDFASDGFTQDFENDDLIFYSNIKTGAFRVYNKKTNYTWSSDVLYIDKYDLNNAAMRQLQSAFTMVYRDSEDKVKQVRTKETKVSLTKSVVGNQIIFNATHSDSQISFTYSLTVNKNKIEFFFDHTSIKEDKCRITSLTFFPYLGSAYQQEVPGYAFIPSGSGALVRLDQAPTISGTYTSAFYGEDANLVTNNEGDLLNLPIYGIVHGVKQNAMLVNIKEGATFAKLNYSPSSIDQNFHMIYPIFNYREPYQLKFSTENVFVIPTDYYPYDIKMDYTILSNDDADYVGLAKEYQTYLIGEGSLVRQNTTLTDISIDMEVFGRDYEKGLILRKYYDMTTTHDILDFNNYLVNNEVHNIFYSLRAFNRRGYSDQSVSNYKFDHKLGKLSDLKDLEAYFYYNPIESYSDARNYPSKVLVNLKNEKNYIKVGVDKYKFYANIKDVTKYTNKATSEYNLIALDGLGYRLYGDNNNKLNKTDALITISNLLGDKRYPLYSPNDYLLKNTSKYLNTPLYSERLRFFTDSVPFLEILLKGYIDYYSPYLNFSSNETMDVLKCIEYGCYPAYLVTKQESYLLADTLSSNYYATTFDKNKEAIVANYQYINEALKPVINATITNRITLEVGIYVVQYDNNYQIVVNYTDQAYDYHGTTIPSLGYVGGAIW